MSIFKKALLVFLFLGLLGILFWFWYAAQHSMDEARAFTVNERSSQHQVLIATQGSIFKDSVVSTVVDELRSLPVFIQVIDVGQLAEVNEDGWSVIVILHTWEMFEPQEQARTFIEKTRSKRKLVVISTSGSGEERIAEVDGITSASLLIEVPALSDKIVQRVKTELHLP